MLHPADRGSMYGTGTGEQRYYPGEQREQRSTNEGSWEQMQFGGKGNIGNTDFDFEEQKNKAIYFRGTREQVPLGGPTACLDN